MKILIKCETKHRAPLCNLIPFQGDLKKLSDKNYEKLKQQIVDEGFISPFMVWEQDQLYLLDGHQRFTALNRMKDEGVFELPELFPIVKVQADSFKQAKKRILALSSQYGTMTREGLEQFAFDSEIDIDSIKEEFHFDNVDLDSLEWNSDIDDGITDLDPTLDGIKGKIKVTCEPDDKDEVLIFLKARLLESSFEGVHIE